MRVAFAVPGSLDGSTGGYVYDEKVLKVLREHHEVEVIEVPPSPLSSSDLRLGRLKGYDVVLQDELCRSALVAFNPFVDASVVSVVHLLASEDPTRGRVETLVERAYLRTVDGCVYTSAASRDASPVDVPSVVARPSSRFSPEITEVEVRDRAHDSPLRAVFIGNVSCLKGLGTAVRALRKNGWHLTVAGSIIDEGYVRRIRRLAVTEGVAERVEFVGFLGDAELTSLLRSSHAVVVPSEYESFGTAYAEGMSFGLPAVASSRGGASEVVDDGRNGWLVEPGDCAKVGRLLCELEDDRKRLAKASIAALETAREQPSWQETSRRAVEFVERVAEGGK